MYMYFMFGLGKVGKIAVTLRSIFLKIFTYFVYDSVYNFLENEDSKSF